MHPIDLLTQAMTHATFKTPNIAAATLEMLGEMRRDLIFVNYDHSVETEDKMEKLDAAINEYIRTPYLDDNEDIIDEDGSTDAVKEDDIDEDELDEEDEEVDEETVEEDDDLIEEEEEDEDEDLIDEEDDDLIDEDEDDDVNDDEGEDDSDVGEREENKPV